MFNINALAHVERQRRIQTARSFCNLPDDVPTIVYRHFNEARYADAFLAGYVFVSTLGHCRSVEATSPQSDPNEASVIYQQDLPTSAYNARDRQGVARRLHMSLGSGGEAINCMSVTRAPDMYLLCTSEEESEFMHEKFGRYCIRINDTAFFAQLLTIHLGGRIDLRHAAVGRVEYGPSREYTGLADPPTRRPGFFKPSDPFENEREVRFLWQSAFIGELNRFSVYVPGLSAALEVV